MAANTPGDYIRHHLQNLTYGRHPDGSWGFAHSAGEAPTWVQASGRTLSGQVLLGGLSCGLCRRVAVSISVDKPGRLQSCIEVIVEMVDNSVKETFHGTNPLIAPLALTLFVWVFLMNFMDLIPVDFIPHASYLLGIEYMKVVPTTDVNATFGLAFSVFFLMIYYSIKVKGVGGFFGELAFHPFARVAAGQPDELVSLFQACCRWRFWQPVRRRTHLYLICCLLTFLGAMDPCRALGDLPYPGDHPAGVYFYDVDYCISQYGT